MCMMFMKLLMHGGVDITMLCPKHMHNNNTSALMSNRCTKMHYVENRILQLVYYGIFIDAYAQTTA